MKLLIVSATAGEIGLFTDHLKTADYKDVTVLTTGVGMVATTYALTRHLCTHSYDLVLQAGVGGSFDRNISLGALVHITSDQYGDLGSEDHDNYLDIFELGLLQKDEAPHSGGRLLTPLLPIHEKIGLPTATALTVNSVSGNANTIARRADKYGAATESMEGAAFHYVCLKEGVPFAQVRAISNYVIPRDKSQWQMKDAVINLNKWLIAFVASVQK